MADWAISLRGARRIMLLLAAIGVAAIAVVQNPPDWRAIASFDFSPDAGRLPSSVRKIGYRLSGERSIVFRFSQPILVARILTYPIVARQTVGPGQDWLYGMRVEMLDSTNAVVGARDVFARTVLIDRDGNRRGTFRFYRNGSDMIAPLDEVRIAASRPFVAVRLRALPSDSGVVGIDARVFERKPLIDSVAQSAFYRLDPEERDRLAAPGAFAPDLLTREERASIMRNQWRPVGPEGIEGRDYLMNVLYEEKTATGTQDQSQAEEIEE